jgi:hypothetical protein
MGIKSAATRLLSASSQLACGADYFCRNRAPVSPSVIIDVGVGTLGRYAHDRGPMSVKSVFAATSDNSWGSDD